MSDPITDKARLHPVGHGYDRRDGMPVSILVHATHGRPGTSLRQETGYLLHSAAVSAHYLIGRAGEVVALLAPQWRAWHAGRARLPFGNNDSIGIELHAARTEPITPAQRAALTTLVRDLMARYAIPAACLETHAAAALPTGRKSDPAAWPRADFLAWRAALAAPARRATARHVAWVRAAPSTASAHIATLARGAQVGIAEVVPGEAVAGGLAQWAQLTSGGYVWLPQLEGG